MKTSLLLAIFCGLISISCKKRSFDFASGYSEKGNFILNHSGSFNETGGFTLGNTLSEIELPEEVNINSIYIKSITVTAQKLPGNDADGINISSTITYAGNTIDLFDVNNLKITSEGIEETNIENLNPEAVTLLKDFFTAGICSYLEVPYHGDFDFTDTFFSVTVNGNTSPTNASQANLLFQVKVNYDLSYSACIESFPFMGENCY